MARIIPFPNPRGSLSPRSPVDTTAGATAGGVRAPGLSSDRRYPLSADGAGREPTQARPVPTLRELLIASIRECI
jgi:hypothetical protein